MSENEGGESKSIGAFLLGFLTGVLVCLGAGGALFMVQSTMSSAMPTVHCPMFNEGTFDIDQ